jgi:hypothetical protein
MRFKKFFAGMAVLLLSVSLFFIGCDNGTPDPKYLPGEFIHVDKTETNVATLNAWQGMTVAFTGSSGALTGALRVPPKTTLVLYAPLTAAGGGIEIKGAVYVEAGGNLTAGTSNVTVKEGGVINVSSQAYSLPMCRSVWKTTHLRRLRLSALAG